MCVYVCVCVCVCVSLNIVFVWQADKRGVKRLSPGLMPKDIRNNQPLCCYEYCTQHQALFVWVCLRASFNSCRDKERCSTMVCNSLL